MVGACPTNGGCQNPPNRPCSGNWKDTRGSWDGQGWTGWTSWNATWRAWASAGRRPESWRRTGQSGVNVWPNASMMRDERNRTVNSKLVTLLILLLLLYSVSVRWWWFMSVMRQKIVSCFHFCHLYWHRHHNHCYHSCCHWLSTFSLLYLHFLVVCLLP